MIIIIILMWLFSITSKLADLSNEYYHILPKKDFLYEKVPILNNESAIKEELANLDLLFDIEIATRFMIAAMEKKEGGFISICNDGSEFNHYICCIIFHHCHNYWFY